MPTVGREVQQTQALSLSVVAQEHCRLPSAFTALFLPTGIPSDWPRPPREAPKAFWLALCLFTVVNH